MTNGNDVLEFYENNAEELHNKYLLFKGLKDNFDAWVLGEYVEGRE